MSVRVRIAPSPTGDPHVGTAYIGLLNYCFAKQHGGSFVLRIEDTDQSRCSEGSKQAIFDSLKWLGLSYDEGPDVGGEHGPYIQSERVAAGIYQAAVDKLIADGHAYRCFCTAERLNEVRQKQIAEKASVIGYDRHCRDLDPAESQRRADAGEIFVVRMKAPLEGTFSYTDRLRKQPFEKQWAELDDQVLLKSDGWPTYHLAAVVDDHAMGITHVIRAEEWLNSLPKHIWLNEKLGYEAPEYIHVGLLRNADKSKISKRKNPTNILWYKQQGYLPEALLNFLCLLGHSHPDGEEIFNLEEMMRVFSFDRVNVAGPVFDVDKLNHIQGHYFRDQDDAALKQSILNGIEERLDGLLPLIRERMTFGADITFLTDYLFTDELVVDKDKLVPKGWEAKDSKAALQATLKGIKKAMKGRDFAWTSSCLEKVIAEIAEKNEWKPRQYYMTLRIATSGRANSLPLFESIEQIGQGKVMKRIEAAMQLLR